jgi:uncharacterized repeat protein (TIGR02543 family)
MFGGFGLMALLVLTGCNQGNLKVTLTPPEAMTAGAQWAVDGGDWQAGGATVEKLKAGDHLVSFKPVNGWIAPADSTVTIVKKQTLESTGAYTPVGSNDVTVPDAGGSSEATATAALVAVGLVVGAPTQQCSFTVPPSNVISQTPPAGAIVAPGSTVVLVISTGSCNVTVPDVAGQALAAAEAAVAQAGLVVGAVSEQCHATVPDGTVISQTPAAGGQAIAGSTVDLLVSTGLCDTTTPTIVGLAQAAAGTAVTQAGLAVGTVTGQCSNTVAQGLVISQTPAAGAPISMGASVQMVVSTGGCNVVVPGVTGQTQSVATAAITGIGLIVGNVTQRCSFTVAAGGVVSQLPIAGEDATLGSRVNLEISTGPCPVPVPNVVNLTQAAAAAAISAAGLTPAIGTGRCHATVPQGSVIEQTPAAGEQAAAGSSVTIIVSTGGCTVTVPNVVGMTEANAATAITAANLTVGTVVTRRCHATAPAGTVIEQTPAANGGASPGSVVVLVVSNGTCPVTVPNLSGKTQTEAATAIVAAGLVSGSVTPACSNTVAAGKVISQTPAANSSVSPGSTVNCVVSSGPCPLSVPSVLGLTQAQAASALTSSGLVLGAVTQQCSATVAVGKVIGQTPAAQTSVPPSSAVAVVISTGPCPVQVPDLSGKTQAQATAAISAAGLIPGTATQACDASAPVGIVFDQLPVKDTQVAPGSSVLFKVSTGPCYTPVPDLANQVRAAAEYALTFAWLTLGTVTEQCSGTVTAGNVISQNPPAGESALLGSAVNLLVSTGPCRVTVPSVIGQTQAAASAALIGLGLPTGAVTQECSNFTAAGKVLRQAPAAGAVLMPGATVDLVISSGACPEIACTNTVLEDGGFESGGAKFWTETYTAGSSPITNKTTAGRGQHSGSWWAWFGNSVNADQATLSQNQTIPAAASATLTFYLRILAAGTGAGTMTVSMDGNVVGKFTGKDATAFSGYTQVSINVSNYADGASHTLLIAAGTSGASVFNYSYFLVDDVCLFTSGASYLYPLSVSRTGAGGGTVSGSGIDCGGDCSTYYADGTLVGLTATADANSTFAGWTGADGTGGNTCTVAMDRARTVIADFEPKIRLLNLAVAGTGGATGLVVGYNVNCTGTCQYSYLNGTTVELTASAVPNAKFTGWTGADTTNGNTCTVTLTSDRNVGANFAPDTRTLSVTKTGSGSGLVTSSTGGIDCGATCSAPILVGTTLNLTASASPTSRFVGWTGADSSSGNTCTVAMSDNRSVQANFAINTFVLTVNKTGAGTVTSGSAGINCGGDCSETYNAGSGVVLTAAPSVGYVFSSWTGADSVAGDTCTVTLNGNRTVTANFTAQNHALTISSDGTGSGTVSSNGTGISCPADCTESYPARTVVTLTAAPNAGSTFSVWTGADVANSTATTCTVTMSAVKNVKATFVLTNYLLTISKGGNGKGTIAANGIDCPGDCTESYPGGTSVSMTATPAADSTFTNWTVDATGTTNPYSLTMNSVKNVTANFALKTYTLTTAVSGQGAISPAAGPHTHNSGDSVEITATAGQGWKFDHWTGDFSGSQNPMAVTIDGNKTVTAVFVQIPASFTLQVTKTGNGTVTANGNLINCGQDCSQTYANGTSVTLSAAPAAGYVFQGWGDAISGTSTPATLTMDAEKTVNAFFSAEGTSTRWAKVVNDSTFPLVSIGFNQQQLLLAGEQLLCGQSTIEIPITGSTLSFYAGFGELLSGGTPVTFRGQTAEIDLTGLTNAEPVMQINVSASMGELLSKFKDVWWFDTTDYCTDHTVNYRIGFRIDGRWEMYKWINLQANPHWELAFSGTVTQRSTACGANPVVFSFNGSPYMHNLTYYPQLKVGSSGYDTLYIISPCDGQTILFCRDTPGQKMDEPPAK